MIPRDPTRPEPEDSATIHLRDRSDAVTRQGADPLAGASLCVRKGTQPPTDAAADPMVGRRLGNYRIVQRIAHGGMGVVYRARHEGLGHEVALKVMISGEHASAIEQARFRLEAQSAARLRHPHIVPVHDIGEEDGRCYFTMDFVRGPSLAHMAQTQRLTPERIATLTHKLALALHYAHGEGVVHRDVKPANVLVDGNDEPRLTDFGLARPSEGHARLTHTGDALGTPAYMAPEQVRGQREAIGPATDVYALGATLYELLALRPPFQGNTAMEVMEQVLRDDPLDPRRLQALVPRDLAVIALKCLAKAPAQRYQGAAALAADLQRFLDGQPIAARPQPALVRLGRRALRHKAVLLPAALLLATGLAALAYEWTRRGFLVLHVQPADALIRIDGRAQAPGTDGRWSLEAGYHRLHVSASDHEDQERLLELRRRATHELRLELIRHQGLLEVGAEPPGATVTVAGRRHGTPLRDLPLPTGTHVLEIEAPLHYRANLEVELLRNQRTEIFRSLVRADAWTVEEPDLGPTWFPMSDLDGDGVQEIYIEQYGSLLKIYSGHTGALLLQTQIAAAAHALHLIEDLDGDGRDEFVQAERAPDQSPRTIVTCYELSPPGVVRRWLRDLAVRIDEIQATGRLRGGGLRLRVGERQSILRARDGATAAQDELDPSAPAGPLHPRPGWPFRLLDGQASSETRAISELGAPASCSPLVVDLDGDGRDEIVVATQAGDVHTLDAAGRRLFSCAVGAPLSSMAPHDLDRDGLLDLIGKAGDRLIALRFPRLIWSRRLNHALRPGALLFADLSEPLVVIPTQTTDRGRGAVALRLDHGAERWFSPFLQDNNRVGARYDVDGDGRDEAVLWRRDPDGLLFLDVPSGAARHQLPLPECGYGTPTPVDSDGDGRADTLLACTWDSGTVYCFSGQPLVQRWELKSGRAVWGSPTVADVDDDGRLEILVANRDARVLCIALADGEPRWQTTLIAPFADAAGNPRAAPAPCISALALGRAAVPAPWQAIAVSESGLVTALDAASGRTNWVRAAWATWPTPIPSGMADDGRRSALGPVALNLNVPALAPGL